MLYREVINNTSEEWNKFKENKIKANNMVDFKNNISNSSNDRIDSIADNVMNMNMHSLFNMNISDYQMRLKIYKIMSKYPEINKAITSHVNELLVQDDDGEFIDFKFTDLGEANIPENIKTEINNTALSIFKTSYSISKLRRDLYLYYIEGLLAYEIIKDENDNLRLRKLKNGNFYTFNWNDEVKYFIEFADVETLSDEDLDKLRYDTDAIIRDAMEKRLQFAAFSSNLNEVVKVHPADRILYMRWYENEDEEINNTISFLDNVAPLYNRLATVEAHLVGYRVSRSLTSYAINLDLGDMDYQDKVVELQNYMDDYDTETIYDTLSETTTSIKDVQTINRIFWFTKGGDFGESTVEPLDFKADFDQIDDIKYFEKKLIHMLKYPAYRWNSVGNDINEDGKQKSTSIENGGMLYEELEYQKFLDNTRVSLVENVIEPLLQAILYFNGMNPVIYNKNNFNIQLNEDSKYKLYLKKIEIDTKMELFDRLKDTESMENLYKNILGYTQVEFIELIKSKIREKETGLSLLLNNEDVTPEQLEKIKEHYFEGDKSFENKTTRKNNKYDNIDSRYKKKENKLQLIAIINYFKGIIKAEEIESEDLYIDANNSLVLDK